MSVDGDEHTHNEFLLSQYLDGDLSEADRVDLERRLESDASLSALLEDLRRTDRLVQNWAGAAPELDWSRFQSAISEKRERDDARRRRRLIFRLVTPLSAAAAIAVAATLYFAGDQPASPQPGAPVALVTVDRANEWASDANRGHALSEVTFDRTRPPLKDAKVVPSTVVAVAAVGIGPPPGDPTTEQSAPFF